MRCSGFQRYAYFQINYTVANNNSKYVSNYDTHITNSFLFPLQNDELFERWKRAIPRKDREMTKTDRVCSLHFDESQIEKYYETLMPDGTVDRIIRGHWKLKPGSVPVKFPGPKYLSKTFKTRKPPKVRNFAAANYKRKRIKTTQSPNETRYFLKLALFCSFCIWKYLYRFFECRIRSITDIEDVPVLPENQDKHDAENAISVISSAQTSPKSSYEYHQLSDVMADLPNVTLPSSLWSHTILMGKLLFLEWDERLNVIRKLVVNETLRCQVQ